MRRGDLAPAEERVGREVLIEKLCRSDVAWQVRVCKRNIIVSIALTRMDSGPACVGLELFDLCEVQSISEGEDRAVAVHEREPAVAGTDFVRKVLEHRPTHESVPRAKTEVGVDKPMWKLANAAKEPIRPGVVGAKVDGLVDIIAISPQTEDGCLVHDHRENPLVGCEEQPLGPIQGPGHQCAHLNRVGGHGVQVVQRLKLGECIPGGVKNLLLQFHDTVIGVLPDRRVQEDVAEPELQVCDGALVALVGLVCVLRSVVRDGDGAADLMKRGDLPAPRAKQTLELLKLHESRLHGTMVDPKRLRLKVAHS